MTDKTAGPLLASLCMGRVTVPTSSGSRCYSGVGQAIVSEYTADGIRAAANAAEFDAFRRATVDAFIAVGASSNPGPLTGTVLGVDDARRVARLTPEELRESVRAGQPVLGWEVTGRDLQVVQ